MLRGCAPLTRHALRRLGLRACAWAARRCCWRCARRASWAAARRRAGPPASRAWTWWLSWRRRWRRRATNASLQRRAPPPQHPHTPAQRSTACSRSRACGCMALRALTLRYTALSLGSENLALWRLFAASSDAICPRCARRTLRLTSALRWARPTARPAAPAAARWTGRRWRWAGEAPSRSPSRPSSSRTTAARWTRWRSPQRPP